MCIIIQVQKENECAALEQRVARDAQAVQSQPANGGATVAMRAIKKKYGGVSANTTLFIQPQSTSSTRDQSPVPPQIPGTNTADDQLSETDQRTIHLIGIALRQVMGKDGELFGVGKTNGQPCSSRKKKVNEELVVKDCKVNRADRTGYLVSSAPAY